jgi:hypothetical protein
VVDGGNARLVGMDDMRGAGWTTLGTYGSGTAQFVYLNSVFVKPQSEVVVGQKSRKNLISKAMLDRCQVVRKTD